jgi:uncharacterized protein YcbK (DUF882 family)
LLRTRFDRRTILKAAAGGALLLLGGKPFPRVASAGTASPAPERRLSLFHTHTGKRLSVAYRNGSGEYLPEAVSSLNHFLRCHYNQQVTEMDLLVVDLHAVDESGGQNEIHIISGFRSPEYNEKLHREGRGVARSSYHLLGKAIDFRIPGKSLAALRDAALRLREGGVGYYPGAGFVHIDSGRFRTW